jgi:outer membrane biosynthesis protein TonB
MKNLLLSTAIAIAAFTFSTHAQQPAGATEPVLTKLPRAVNPKDGYSGGGDVHVRVTVNEKGDVTDAEFVSGPGPVCEAISRPDVLKTREAAVELARQAKFTPATNGGQTVESSTVISVEFAVPKPKPQASTGKKFTVIGDRNYSAAQAPEKPVTDPEPKPDTSSSSAAAKALPVRDENVYLASNAPPTTGTGSYKGKTISGGVLNGRAISLPKPKYPAAARAVRASGAVQVQVLIDEDGNVFSAEAAGGHPLLQNVSVVAACSSKFQPTLLAGEPVKVSGIITYNFVP